MTEIIDTIPTNKIYKDRYMFGVVYLGGPLAAGYIMAENFKSFGDLRKYKITWIITIITTITLFTTIFLIPDSIKIPNYIIPLIYSAIAVGLMKNFQGDQINKHLASDGPTYNGWRAFLVGLISIIITLAVFIPVGYFIMPNEESEVFMKTYGNTTHQIQYIPSKMNKSEVDVLSSRLGEIQYLDSIYSMTLFVDKEGKELQIWIPFIGPAWTNPEDVLRHTQLKDILTEYYPNNKIVVNICDSNWTVKKTIQ